jgi:predicted DCC family thiol-disulfide oxidoreductase YuxK
MARPGNPAHRTTSEVGCGTSESGSREDETDRKSTTADHRPGAGGTDGDAGEILLVYDRECPACDTYCNLVRVPPSAGTLRIVDARESTPIMREISEAGLDIDQGMVVKTGGRLYYGADAIHVLALLGSRSDLFNLLTGAVFRSGTLSRVLYPVLRACRNLLLKVMGKTRINNLGIEGNERF